MGSFSNEEISWICESNEPPEVYFEKFNISDKRFGHRRYSRLIECSGLDDGSKKAHLSVFEAWKINEATGFWLRRRAKMAKMETATALVDGSVAYAESAILGDDTDLPTDSSPDVQTPGFQNVEPFSASSSSSSTSTDSLLPDQKDSLHQDSLLHTGLSEPTSSELTTRHNVAQKDNLLDGAFPVGNPMMVLSRSGGERIADGGEKGLDKAEISHANDQSHEQLMEAEGTESNEIVQFGSHSVDNAHSEGHAMFGVSRDDKVASKIIRNFLQSCPYNVASPSPMPAFSNEFADRAVSPTTDSGGMNGGYMQDTEHRDLDGARSDYQPVKWRLESQYNPDKTPTGSQNPFLCTPTKQANETQASESPETRFTLSEKFNQDTTFVYKGIDIVEIFHEYRSKDSDNFSFARDWIADFSSGSQFERALPAHLTPALNLSELAIIDVNTGWPTLTTVFDRVFASNSYDEVASAIKNEDLADPVAFYLISIIVSYSHYFAFHEELPKDINEREAFVGFAWSFIRGAFTLTNIETRALEILITGVEERKNHGSDPRFDTKQVGQFADGAGFSGADQIYLAEAALLHEPRPEKLKEDEYKLVRAMRDSWISQLKDTCREYVPCRAMTVFGSSSYRDETKFWLLDFKGVFRLFHFDSFLIPLRKKDFGRKMKTAVLSCIELAVRVEMEMQKRESERVPVSFRERLELKEAICGIRTTSPTPEKPKKRKFSI